MLSMLAVMTAMTVQAQIGYKGQVTAAIDGGITHLGGFVGAARSLSFPAFGIRGRCDV